MSRSEDAGGLFNNALMDGAGERGTEKACLLMAGGVDQSTPHSSRPHPDPQQTDP